MIGLITPIILLIFGGAIFLVVWGFYLLDRRISRPRYENEDYYRYWRRKSEKEKHGPRPVYPDGPTFDGERPGNQARFFRIGRREKVIALVVVGVTLVGIGIAIVYNYPEALLLIFTLPIILRFIRSRNGSPSCL